MPEWTAFITLIADLLICVRLSSWLEEDKNCDERVVHIATAIVAVGIMLIWAKLVRQ